MSDLHFVNVIASNGQEIEVPSCMMTTGFGRVVNGWCEGVEHFDKYSDGDTVVVCEAGHPGAMTIADAFQAFRNAGFEERVELALYEIVEGFDADWIAESDDAQIEARARFGRMLGDPAPLTFSLGSLLSAVR